MTGHGVIVVHNTAQLYITQVMCTLPTGEHSSEGTTEAVAELFTALIAAELQCYFLCNIGK